MPSKEEYLDNLLKGLMNEQDQMFVEDSSSADGMTEEPLAKGEEPAVEEEPVFTGEPFIPEDAPMIEASPISEDSLISEDLFASENMEKPSLAEETTAEEPVYEDLTGDRVDGPEIQEESVADEASDEEEFDIGDVDSVLGNATEDDIEKILNENRESVEEPSDDEPTDFFDFSDEDEDVADINNMLEKSDRNEAIDEDILALLQNIPDDDAKMSDGEENEGGADDTRSRKAEEKRLKREAKKEAKKEAKQLAKEAKKAKKEARKAAKAKSNEAADGTDGQDNTLFLENSDADVTAEMDAFLSGALNDGNQETQKPEQEENDLAEAGIDDLVRTLDDSGEHDTGALVDEVFSLEDAVDEISEEDHKKKGFFARILDFLTEEDEEDEESEDAQLKLSEENQNILDELDSESGNGKKGKKGKKAKKGKKDKKAKKGSKGKSDNADEEIDGEEIASEDEGKKGKKAKKAKKPKKEKALEPGDEKPSKKLSTKRIALIAIICLSILAVIILLTNLLSDYSVKKAGRQAFAEGDYQTCYQNLYGKDLSESEQVMFGRSECILRVRLWIREYEMFADEGLELEALDSLIQSVNDYPDLYEYAVQWNSVGEVSEIYNQMLDILSQKYGITEEQAREIAAEPDDVEYTKKVNAIVNGEAGSAADSAKDSTAGTKALKDILPEEEGLVGASFVDNM